MGFVTYLLLFRNGFLDEHVSLKRAKNKSLKRATKHFEKFKSPPDGGTHHHPSPNPSRFSPVPARAGVRSYIYSETLRTWRRASSSTESFSFNSESFNFALTVGSQRYPLQSFQNKMGEKLVPVFVTVLKLSAKSIFELGYF